MGGILTGSRAYGNRDGGGDYGTVDIYVEVADWEIYRHDSM